MVPEAGKYMHTHIGVYLVATFAALALISNSMQVGLRREGTVRGEGVVAAGGDRVAQGRRARGACATSLWAGGHEGACAWPPPAAEGVAGLCVGEAPEV